MDARAPGGAFSAKLRAAKAPAARGGYGGAGQPAAAEVRRDAVPLAAGAAPATGAGDDASLGGRMSRAVSSSAKGLPLEDGASLEMQVMAFLSVLKDGYAAPEVQAELAHIVRETAGSQVNFLMALAPLAGRVQAPVFKRYGLPPGNRGITLMKLAVKLLSEGCSAQGERGEAGRRSAGECQDQGRCPPGGRQKIAGRCEEGA